MPDVVDLDKITDITELKVMKSDSYDELNALNARAEQTKLNINAITARVNALANNTDTPEDKATPTTETPA